MSGPFTAGVLPPEFREAMAVRAPRLAEFAAHVAWYDAVTSTNDIADRAASGGAEHGTVVAADFQECGRGRMGRTWYSPPGAGLYVSIVLRPDRLGAVLDGVGGPAAGAGDRRSSGAVSGAASITLTAGVALAESLRASTGLQAAIKWPNDLVVGGRKVCGILAEAAAAGGVLQHVILGYGINVLPAAYPREIADRATSIEAEVGRPVDRAAVFAESLASLAEWMRELTDGGLAPILDRWRTLSPSCTGQAVEVVQGPGWVPAITAGIDHDGALLVRTGETLRRVIAGEVRWRAW